MGDGHNGDAQILVEVVDGLHHLLTAARVEHGGGLVEDEAVGTHGDDARNGDALLLAAREVVGCALPELVDARHLHGVINAAAHLFRRNTEVFQRESHVFLYHRGDDLVVRALEHHAHGLADVIELVIIGGVHALDVHLALLRQEDGVEVLGKGGFAAAVCAQHGHELAPPDLHGDAVERVAGLLRVVAEL